MFEAHRSKLIVLLAIVFAVSLSLTACKGKGESSAPAKNTEGVSGNTANSGEGATIKGKVIQTMDSGGYTYVLLENNGKKTWVAMPSVPVKKGEILEVEPGTEMNNFTSKTLNRTFERIIFSSGPVNSGMETGFGPSASASKVIPSKPELIKVKKATGKDAYTIAEIYANASKLNEKPVVVRGKVVKVLTKIMGKNWVHIQDGTGEPSKEDYDLVVTTQDLPKVGDIVLVKGTAFADKDFGSGYRYKVIIENATVTKETGK